MREEERGQKTGVGGLRSEGRKEDGKKRGLAPQYDFPNLRGKQRRQGAKIKMVSHRAHSLRPVGPTARKEDTEKGLKK